MPRERACPERSESERRDIESGLVVDQDTRAGAPSPERLHAAITLVVAKLQPDQIILFGSAARNEMSERSDLDLLVIKERGKGVPPRHEPVRGRMAIRGAAG